MTRLLEMAFKKASELPEVQQNALAKWLLRELEAQTECQKRPAESEDILDWLADEILEAHRRGKTDPTSRIRGRF